MSEIREIADLHGALIVEDAAESLGATYSVTPDSALALKLGKSGAVQTGLFGDYGCISFNGNNVFEIGRDAGICNKEPKNREGRSIFLSIMHNNFGLLSFYVNNIVTPEVDVILMRPEYVRTNVPENDMYIYLKESVKRK